MINIKDAAKALTASGTISMSSNSGSRIRASGGSGGGGTIQVYGNGRIPNTDYPAPIDEELLEIYIKNTVHNMVEVSLKDYLEKYADIFGKMYWKSVEVVDNSFYITRGYDLLKRPLYLTIRHETASIIQMRCFIHKDFFIFEELGS
jgi:hypothetical protein